MPHTQQTFEDLIAILTQGERVPQDWRSLVALASETLTVGGLADRVLAEDWKIAVPQEVRELLEDVRERAQKRNRLVASQFCELLGPLNAVGIKPVAMKGLARLLASPDERSRILSDIDLLVPSDRRNDCVQVFTSLGYEIIVGADDASFPPVFARSRDVGTVDLHTRLKPPDLNLGYEAIAPHCREFRVAEGIVLLPDATSQLVLAVLHDQLNDRDYWRGFIDVRHLIDLDRLVREGVDWTLTASFFQDGVRKRAFNVQMLTAHRLLGITIPEEHRNGLWAKLQLLRRRLQWRVPKLRPLFTLITIAVDPPRASAPPAQGAKARTALQRTMERLEKYIWRAYPGKI